MQNKKSFLIGAVITAALLAVLGYFVYKDLSGSAIDLPSDLATTTTITKDGVTFIVPKGSNPTIETVPINEVKLPPIPDLNRPLVFPVDFPVEAKEVITKNIAILKANIQKDPKSLDNWLDLGMQRKIIADYEGARQAWEYATVLYPKDAIAFANLGFLYGYYLRDSVKAEQDYRQAITNSPTMVMYQSFFEFYRDVLKDFTKARALATEGVSKLPGNKADFDKLLKTLK